MQYVHVQLVQLPTLQLQKSVSKTVRINRLCSTAGAGSKLGILTRRLKWDFSVVTQERNL